MTFRVCYGTVRNVPDIKPSGTSNDERDLSAGLWVVWALHRVQTLVSLAHSIYDEVAAEAVELDPTVDHIAVPHHEDFGRAGWRPVQEGDLDFQGGQKDVEILPVEQGQRFFDDEDEEDEDDWAEERRSIDMCDIPVYIFHECTQDYRWRTGASSLTFHRFRKSCEQRRKKIKIKSDIYNIVTLFF